MALTDCGSSKCSKKIKPSNKAVQCEICEIWWHMECTDLEESEYDVLSKGSSCIHWFCEGCNRGSRKMLLVIQKLQTELDEVRKEFTDFKKKVVTKSNFNIDRNEQYSRKDSARISNITDPHDKEEDTNGAVIKLAKDIGVVIKSEDISTSHRLGKVTATYDRPIIVKFVRRDTKRNIMMKRRLLKDHAVHSNVYINDDLTRMRYKISKELRNQNYNVWSRDGKIFYKVKDTNDITMVDSYEDFCKLQWSEEKLTELDILQ